MRKLRVGIFWFALGWATLAVADEADPRAARVTDAAGAESVVSGLTVTNVNERFGIAPPEDRGRLLISTATFELAIPLRAISSVRQLGGAAWLVTYQGAEGEATVTGSLATTAELSGSSDFGTFTLPLAKLRRLEYQKPGIAAKPAKRPEVHDQEGHLRAANFDAVLTLVDGTRLTATQLRRNEVSATRISDPALLTRPDYAIVCTNYTDLQLVRGETLQTIPFENVKSLDYFSDARVRVTSRSGLEAEMKVARRSEETLEGFNGTCSKGDFYVPLKFVKSITFGGNTN
jgi:hypothetical protein